MLFRVEKLLTRIWIYHHLLGAHLRSSSEAQDGLVKVLNPMPRRGRRQNHRLERFATQDGQLQEENTVKLEISKQALSAPTGLNVDNSCSPAHLEVTETAACCPGHIPAACHRPHRIHRRGQPLVAAITGRRRSGRRS